ncbi:unnamed protein product [Pleuronectes platessa]|uniref:Leucine rich repeat containing 31 n=1 Tax=Pleuronectes platessa TaxID=8262 RepID=A0A9N7YQI1_PLEPL|nr:unnamed protein product [Pleuronectes platessa]
MDSAGGQRGRDAPRRSPLDIIMSQIRRKRTASDRKPLGRFLSRTSERTGGIPEDGESGGREERAPSSGAAEDERDVSWGRVCVFLQRLGKKADSRSLSLAHCDVTATDLLELATLLQFLPQLEEMDVSWNELIGGSLQALTSHLHLVGGARTLRLCGCRLNADDVTALGEALGCVPHLEILDLSWNGGLSATDASALGGVLSSLHRLSVLDVSCNPRLSQDGGGGFSDLAAALCHAPSLTTLGLQACGLSTSCLDALGGSLRHLPSVREMDLSCNKGLSGGLHHLSVHLAHLPRLESLDLHLCCLTHTDLEALIQVLPSLTALTELNVSSNQEAGAVLHALVSALPLTQMKRLPLNSCRLSEESFTALALAVPFLHTVDVSWCKALGGRVALLLDALQPALVQELRLSSCELSTEDLVHLAVVCRRGCMSSLLVLDLSYNGSVGAAGWSALFEAGGLGSLEDVDLSLRPSTSASCSAWLPALLCALPRLPALTRLAMQRWTMSSRERQQLSHSARKRNVLLELDPDSKDTASSGQTTNQESPEE